MSVEVAIPVRITRHRFTVNEYERMGQIGIFSEDERVELVCGEVIEMSPIGNRHAACVDAFAELLREQLGRSVIVRVQNPIRLDNYSEPQPDISILKRRDDFYRHAHPGPGDVLLVIEVSDTTLEYDRKVKVPLYARAGVPEVWVVNLSDERIEAHAAPSGGDYQSVNVYARGEEVQSRSLAALRVGVAEVLG
ncbi:MAG: Uma2 family endonuclease [Pyrinomonadaceae bacterium]